MSESSPYAFQLRKVHELRDYLLDHLMLHYGIKSLTLKASDLIAKVSMP